MTAQTLLYCVGATKAGTSWLYRVLHDHPECKLRDVKEAHYWDTMGPKMQANQTAAFDRRIAEFTMMQVRAEVNGNTARAENLALQIDELKRLRDVIAASRSDDAAYWDWLSRDADGAKLIADMTPSYALVNGDMLKRMLALRPVTKVVYLIRDPLARLWSHVRMTVTRSDEDSDASFDERSNAVLASVIREGAQKHITKRGDYAAVIEKLRRIVPASDLMIEFAENLFTAEGWARMCRFLGITDLGVDQTRKVHEGNRARLHEDLAVEAVKFLKDQYEWVAKHVAPLPQEWQANLARVRA